MRPPAPGSGTIWPENCGIHEEDGAEASQYGRHRIAFRATGMGSSFIARMHFPTFIHSSPDSLSRVVLPKKLESRMIIIEECWKSLMTPQTVWAAGFENNDTNAIKNGGHPACSPK